MLVSRRFLGLLIVTLLCFLTLGLLVQRVQAAVDFSGVPSGPGDILAFETPANWTADTFPVVVHPEWPGPELEPPGRDSIFFIEDQNVTIKLSDERSGNNGTMALGAMALGRNPDSGTELMVQKLIIDNDVTFTGLERRSQGDGFLNTTLRHIRVGRGRNAGDGDGSDVHAWGYVQQTAGLVDLQQDETMTGTELPVSPQTSRAEILLSSDKDKSAGSIWEVGGTASLTVPDEIRMSDRESIIQFEGQAIFRVRGSQHTPVGTPIDVNTYVDPQSIQSSITVGFPFTALATAGRFKVNSRGAMAGATQPGGDYGAQVQYNEGKAIAEFVLDAGGTTPIVLEDQLIIGGDDISPAGDLEGFTLHTPGFLRVRLMEPTTAGFVGEDPVYLFHADRIGTDTSDGYVTVGTEFDEGRFFDPDRDGPSLSVGLTPHRRMWDGDTVISEYAGATYNWTIEYFEPGVGEGDAAGSDDGDIDSYVRLVDGTVTGTPGDYNTNTVLDASDIDSIFAAMGTPIGLGTKQNMFDLDGDEDVDYDDATEWVTHASFANTLFGDLDLNGSVVQGDLDTLLGNLNMSGGWADGDLDGNAFVDTIDRDILLANCTGCSIGGLPGDYNDDEVIDGADYTAWRDAVTAGATSLPNDPTPGTVDESDFLYWRAHYGETAGSGGGSGAAAVPEPASVVLAVLSVLGLMSFRRRA